MHIDFYNKYDRIAEIDFDPKKETVSRYKTYSDNIIFLPFGVCKTPDYRRLCEYFKSRCWDPSRPDIDRLLNKLGLDFFEPLAIVKKTHGLMFKDFLWMKFDSDPEDLTYDKIKVRTD